MQDSSVLMLQDCLLSQSPDQLIFLRVSLEFLELFKFFYQLVRDSARHGSFLFQLFMTNDWIVDVAKFI